MNSVILYVYLLLHIWVNLGLLLPLEDDFGSLLVLSEVLVELLRTSMMAVLSGHGLQNWHGLWLLLLEDEWPNVVS